MNELMHEQAMEDAMAKLKELFEPAFETYMQSYQDQLDDSDVGPQPPLIVEPTGDFKVFDLIRYKNKPSAAALGMHPMTILYESAFWGSDKASHDLPSKSVVQALARKHKGTICVDVERWADMKNRRGDGYWRVLPEDVEKYKTLLTWYRDAMPDGNTMGLYSILPVRNLWDAAAARDSSKFSKWQGWNNEVQPIAEHVDMVMPSCYTFNDDEDLWRRYCIAQIDEARRIAPGKPVYPVFWPRIHPGNKGPISDRLWRVHLETAREHADGCIIWTISSQTKRVDWSDVPSWWAETEKFIKGL